jgi:hypothetical protein
MYHVHRKRPSAFLEDAAHYRVSYSAGIVCSRTIEDVAQALASARTTFPA